MVYKYIHIIGTSANNIDDAVKEAIDEASKTINNIEWAELGRVTFRILDNQVKEFQAEVKIGFKISHSVFFLLYYKKTNTGKRIGLVL